MINLYKEGKGEQGSWTQDGIEYTMVAVSNDDDVVEHYLNLGWFRSFDELKFDIEQQQHAAEHPEPDPQVKPDDPFAGWERRHYHEYLKQNNVQFGSKDNLERLRELAQKVHKDSTS